MVERIAFSGSDCAKDQDVFLQNRFVVELPSCALSLDYVFVGRRVLDNAPDETFSSLNIGPSKDFYFIFSSSELFISDQLHLNSIHYNLHAYIQLPLLSKRS